MAAAGCGDAPEYVEFAEVCGVAEPVRVLEFGPGDCLDAEPWRFGDRVVLTTAHFDLYSPTGRNGTRTVWTTGPCGEAPVRFAEGVGTTFTIEQWPDVLLGCDDMGEQILALDPEGRSPPHVVFTGLRSCGGLSWTAQGLVSLAPRADGTDLLTEVEAPMELHRYPEDPWLDTAVAEPLLDLVRVKASRGQTNGPLYKVFPDFVLALTGTDELVRADLAGGAVTVVQTGVRDFEASKPDGRYLVWQDLTPTDDNANYPGQAVPARSQRRQRGVPRRGCAGVQRQLGAA